MVVLPIVREIDGYKVTCRLIRQKGGGYAVELCSERLDGTAKCECWPVPSKGTPLNRRAAQDTGTHLLMRIRSVDGDGKPNYGGNRGAAT